MLEESCDPGDSFSPDVTVVEQAQMSRCLFFDSKSTLSSVTSVVLVKHERPKPQLSSCYTFNLSMWFTAPVCGR